VITFTVPDAARAARVPERTLRRAIAQGELRASRPRPRLTLVWWDDVANWVVATRRPATGPAGGTG
jgi:excisionase family DNA binding protein